MRTPQFVQVHKLTSILPFQVSTSLSPNPRTSNFSNWDLKVCRSMSSDSLCHKGFSVWLPSRHPMHFRHYLHVKVPKHRIALTRLLLSDHSLAIEQLRRGTRTRPYYPRHLRLCRFCLADIEDPIHALLVCDANEDLSELRRDAMNNFLSRAPYLKNSQSMTNPQELFRRLYSDKKLVDSLARFAYRVLAIFDSVPMHIPHPSTITNLTQTA